MKEQLNQWIVKGKSFKKAKTISLCGKMMGTILWNGNNIEFVNVLLEKLKMDTENKRPHLKVEKVLFFPAMHHLIPLQTFSPKFLNCTSN